MSIPNFMHIISLSLSFTWQPKLEVHLDLPAREVSDLKIICFGLRIRSQTVRYQRKFNGNKYIKSMNITKMMNTHSSEEF